MSQVKIEKDVSLVYKKMDELSFLEVWLEKPNKESISTKRILYIKQCFAKACDALMPRECPFPS